MPVYRFRWLVAVLAIFLAACDDPYGPQFWNPAPQAVTLYSASRAEYVGLVSAIDLVSDPIQTVMIEAPGATGNWDVVLIDGAQNLLSLAPAEVFPGVSSRARIAVIRNRTFDEVLEAPRDTAAYTAGPVALETGVVYVIRSRRAACGFTTGVRYAKLEPTEIDHARGIFRASVVRNPFCDDRSLVPPE